MRTSFLLSIVFVLVFVSNIQSAFADAGGINNGSACDYNGTSGMMQDGQCVPPDLFQGSSATGGSANDSLTLMNPLQGGTSLESFLSTILSFVIRIGAIIVVLMLVYVGYLFVMAQGSDSKLSEARKALLWTIIGALILLGAQAIAIGIESTVNALSAGT